MCMAAAKQCNVETMSYLLKDEDVLKLNRDKNLTADIFQAATGCRSAQAKALAFFKLFPRVVVSKCRYGKGSGDTSLIASLYEHCCYDVIEWLTEGDNHYQLTPEHLHEQYTASVRGWQSSFAEFTNLVAHFYYEGGWDGVDASFKNGYADLEKSQQAVMTMVGRGGMAMPLFPALEKGWLGRVSIRESSKDAWDLLRQHKPHIIAPWASLVGE
eukprot:TRINITY_DN6280_c0_g1_i1.p1 TRINITY_DN6280_c0_g1~~TRINITY_DN6280_c0_g1_i1.p1  ORF type:complete len:214 (-),score=33.49 TRINITY_DN6280_c0_g1_i1:229-870(-)